MQEKRIVTCRIIISNRIFPVHGSRHRGAKVLDLSEISPGFFEVVLLNFELAFLIPRNSSIFGGKILKLYRNVAISRGRTYGNLDQV